MNTLFIRALITEKCVECVSFEKCVKCARSKHVFMKRNTFFLDIEKIIFKKKLSKANLPFRFGKLASILAENGLLQYFVLIVIEALVALRKMLSGTKLFDVRKVRFLDLQLFSKLSKESAVLVGLGVGHSPQTLLIISTGFTAPQTYFKTNIIKFVPVYNTVT